MEPRTRHYGADDTERSKNVSIISQRAGDTQKLDTTYASSRSRQTLPRGKPKILNIRSRVLGVFIRAVVNSRAAQETKSYTIARAKVFYRR